VNKPTWDPLDMVVVYEARTLEIYDLFHYKDYNGTIKCAAVLTLYGPSALMSMYKNYKEQYEEIYRVSP